MLIHERSLMGVDSSRPVAVFAANELARYGRLMTRKKLDISATSAGAPGKIVIAGVGDALWPRVPPEIKALSGGIENDGFGWGVLNDCLWITAKEPRGLLFGVYDLLEHGGGVCFGGPHAGEEYVPRSDAWDVGAPFAIQNPDLRLRLIGLHNHCSASSPDYPFDWNKAIDWFAKRKLNGLQVSLDTYQECRGTILKALTQRGLIVEVGGHSFPTLIRKDEYFQSHPEYYARDAAGKVYPGNFCYAKPALREELCAKIAGVLAACPEIAIFDLWPADGAPFCQCAKCREKTPVEWLVLVNRQIAEEVGKKFPRVEFTHLIYDAFVAPPNPAQPFPKNLQAQFCDYYDRIHSRPIYDYFCSRVDMAAPEVLATVTPDRPLRAHRRLCEDLAAWTALTADNSGLFTYYSTLVMLQVITFRSDIIRRDVAYCQAAGLKGFTECLCYPERWMNMALTLTALGELSWNHRVSNDALLGRFARGMFGPGTEDTIGAYYRILDEMLNQPAFMGFYPLDLMSRNPREALKFAGFIERLVEPTGQYYAETFAQLRQVVGRLEAVASVNPKSANELRLATEQLEIFFNLCFAFYLAFCYESAGKREQARAQLERAESLIARYRAHAYSMRLTNKDEIGYYENLLVRA